MDNDRLKQRLVGAAVLISLVVVFLPMLVEQGPEPVADRPAVPERPSWEFTEWKASEYETPDVLPAAEQQVIDTEVTEVEEVGPDRQMSAQTAVGEDAPDTLSGTLSGTAPEQPTEDASPGGLVEAQVRKGDNLYRIFERHGLGASQVRQVIRLGAPAERLSRLRPGQRLQLRVDDGKRLGYLEYRYGGATPLRLERRGGELAVVGQTGGTAAKAARQPQQSTPAQARADKPPHRDPERARRDQPVTAWAVQVAAVSDFARAQSIKEGLRGKKYTAFVKRDRSGKRLWKVKVGPETRRTNALALARKLEQDTGQKTLVVSYP